MVLYKTAAAVCLVALYGLHSEAGTVTTTYKFKAVNVEDDAYFAAKLVRNGKLAVHISEVSKDEDLISELQEKVAPSADLEQQTGTSEVSCNKLMEDSGLVSASYPTGQNSCLRRCGVSSSRRRTIWESGGRLVHKGYQNKWNEIWGDADGANLAYLLGANSTKIGCVIGECIKVQTQEDDEPPTTENPTGDAFLFCQLSPAADKNKAPFDEDYFNALTARTAKLAAMTEEDLKAPSNGASATAAIPTILVASLVAMLTAVPA